MDVVEPKCVICNRVVKPETAYKAKYVIHEACFKRVAPTSAKLQRTGDEPI